MGKVNVVKCLYKAIWKVEWVLVALMKRFAHFMNSLISLILMVLYSNTALEVWKEKD